jgi:hypothetical protein
MDELIAELKKRVDFKKTLDTGDVVLIAADDPQVLAFAVVTDISRDSSRRDEWWHVKMQMLSVPLQTMIWTLRMEQMCGHESFTMGGKNRFMAPVMISYDDAGHKSARKEGLEKKNKKNRSSGLRVVK